MARLRTAALLAASIVGGTAALAGGPYVNPQLKFGFTPPYGWTQASIPDVVVAFVEPGASAPAAKPGPPRKETNREFLDRLNKKLSAPVAPPAPFRANITVMVVQRPGIVLAAYVRETRTRANKLKGCAVLGEADRRLGGLPAIERTTRMTFTDRPPIRTREVMCQRGDLVYTVALAAPNGQYKRHSDDFEKTLASFIWR